jgi:hypothetical protein
MSGSTIHRGQFSHCGKNSDSAEPDEEIAIYETSRSSTTAHTRQSRYGHIQNLTAGRTWSTR